MSKLNRLLEDKIIDYHDSCNLRRSKFIGSGGSASVYVANWKNTSTKYAIKRCVDDKEVYLTYLANSHENIIQFRGITNFEDDEKYSLVLEYAEGGTLGKYLRDDTLTLKWENQLKFAKEITSAILWLHVDKGIVHGDLHPNNILIHKDTIKLADFGRSCQKESGCYNSEPVPNTNVKFMRLYQECWKQEPDERPHISKVNEVLNIIDSENSGNNDVSTVPYRRGSEESTKKTEFVHSCQIDLNILCQKY
ncbi:unnamed protein product [Rhizophagus irregularis]|uniref:Protein kinase domain-containing protein n=1 Tax=Rhizophagus irregularis TaxID=588596 RepID=A0A916E8I0_9GLOM|nr:unnamed protein product [Rhizophagus irregularis]